MWREFRRGLRSLNLTVDVICTAVRFADDDGTPTEMVRRRRWHTSALGIADDGKQR